MIDHGAAKKVTEPLPFGDQPTLWDSLSAKTNSKALSLRDYEEGEWWQRFYCPQRYYHMAWFSMIP